MNNTRITKIFDRIIGARSRRDLEDAYLNRAVSGFDLERRMREIDNGKFRGF